MGEATRWVLLYVGLAIAFGIGIGLGIVAGGQYGTESFAGYLMEYSLWVDDLFVFEVFPEMPILVSLGVIVVVLA